MQRLQERYVCADGICSDRVILVFTAWASLDEADAICAEGFTLADVTRRQGSIGLGVTATTKATHAAEIAAKAVNDGHGSTGGSPSPKQLATVIASWAMPGAVYP